MKFNFRAALLLTALLLAASFAAAQTPAEKKPGEGKTAEQKPAEKKTSEPKPAEQKVTDPAVKVPASILRDSNGRMIFPDISGWQKDEIYVYPPGLGYSINYMSPSARVTVYEYDNGETNIPSEIGALVRKEIAGAKAQIRAAEEAGIYSDVKELSTETVILGGEKGKVKTLRVQMTLRRGEARMNSDIYVFPYNGKFIKLRVTRHAAPDKAADEAFALLLSDLDALFAK